MSVGLISKIIHVINGFNVHYEMYVVDGTVSPLPQRNFHNVSHPHLPMSGVYKIDIKHQPSPSDEAMFTAGSVLLLPNVRAKDYRGEMEIIWSEKVTDEQEAKGWRTKRACLIPPEDERALAIER